MASRSALGVRVLARTLVHVDVAHGEAGDEAKECGAAGPLSVAASLLNCCGQESLGFAEKRAADLDGEDQALGFEDVQAVAEFEGSLLLSGFGCWFGGGFYDGAKRDSSTAQAEAFAGSNAEEKVGLLRSE